MPDFITLTGRKKSKSLHPYVIKWDGKSRSKYQFNLKQFLKRYIQTHIVYEEFPVVGSRMTLDIVDMTSRVAYEMQGEFHTQFSKFAHVSRANYLAQIKRDMSKQRWCELNNLTLVEIYPGDFPLTKEIFANKYNVIL